MAQGQILVDILDEIRGLRVDLARFRSSSSPPPFDDGFWSPFGIPSQKGQVHMRCFWHLYLFLFLGGEFIFVGWSLWSCLDCIYVLTFYFTFLALALFVLPCWVIQDRGSIFCCFLFQTAYWSMYMSSSFIYVFIVCCMKSRFYFSLLVFFPHMRLCILFKCFRKYTGWFN